MHTLNNSILLICLTILLASCITPTPDSPQVTLDETFDLAYGAGAFFPEGGFEIVFKELTEDSRCPIGVTCVWAGNAGVVISVSGEDLTLNTEIEPQESSIDGYLILLIDVEPYPKAGEELQPEDYWVSLIILEK